MRDKRQHTCLMKENKCAKRKQGTLWRQRMGEKNISSRPQPYFAGLVTIKTTRLGAADLDVRFRKSQTLIISQLSAAGVSEKGFSRTIENVRVFIATRFLIFFLASLFLPACFSKLKKLTIIEISRKTLSDGLCLRISTRLDLFTATWVWWPGISNVFHLIQAERGVGWG